MSFSPQEAADLEEVYHLAFTDGLRPPQEMRERLEKLMNEHFLKVLLHMTIHIKVLV